MGCGSSVVIDTGYVMYSTGIESRLRARFSTPVQTDPGAHPTSCHTGDVFISLVKAAGSWLWSPTTTNAEVKERVLLTLHVSIWALTTFPKVNLTVHLW